MIIPFRLDGCQTTVVLHSLAHPVNAHARDDTDMPGSSPWTPHGCSLKSQEPGTCIIKDRPFSVYRSLSSYQNAGQSYILHLMIYVLQAEGFQVPASTQRVHVYRETTVWSLPRGAHSNTTRPGETTVWSLPRGTHSNTTRPGETTVWCLPRGAHSNTTRPGETTVWCLPRGTHSNTTRPGETTVWSLPRGTHSNTTRPGETTVWCLPRGAHSNTTRPGETTVWCLPRGAHSNTTRPGGFTS